MNKQEIVRDIRSCVGNKGVISKNQLSKYLGIDRHNKKLLEYIEGLPYIPDGRGNKYYIQDIAGRIIDKTIC